MAGETTSTSVGVLITTQKGKGTYRVYKPKKAPKRKKWRNQSGKGIDLKDWANQNLLIKNLKHIKLQDVQQVKSLVTETALLKIYIYPKN